VSYALRWPSSPDADPYGIVGILEAFGISHAGHEKVTPALAHDCSDNCSSAQRPELRVVKFEKNSRKGYDSFENKMSFLLKVCFGL
jgi:hypothetical protein